LRAELLDLRLATTQMDSHTYTMPWSDIGTTLTLESQIKLIKN